MTKTGAAVLVAGLLTAGGLTWLRSDGGYQVTFVFPNATNLIAGSRVQVDGFTAGRVLGLEPRDGQALVRVRLDAEHAPLRAGTTARIAYQSLLGERVVEIVPGSKDHAPIPDGGMVTGNTPRVELDELLQAQDPETRAAVSRLLPELDRALAGREDDVGDTLETAGPAVEALTEVLKGVGEDGPALRQLLVSVRALSERLVDRRQAVRETIDGFERNMSAVARQDEALHRGLDDLPAAIRQASTSLGRIPGTAAAALPLLADLRSATEALPESARDLRPFVAELRPTLAELRPTLVSLAALLVETPSMLDVAHSTVPQVTSAVSALLPAIDFLRPYTPEIAGLVANLGSASANFDANGHYLRVFVSAGSASLADSPSTVSPSLQPNPHRAPGELEHQPVDAAGSRVR